jgi:hypothetical protein
LQERPHGWGSGMAEFRLFLPDDLAGILGSVDENGVLTFVVFAKAESPIRGTEMFDLMIRAFGDRVRAVLGVWRRGYEGSPSVNVDKVNERTSTGLSLEEAIQQTWTFTRAARWGYSRITRVDIDGTPGHYTKIDVLLEKAGESG